MTSGRLDGSGKEQLGRTEEFHYRFEEAVNRLGGPDRATPNDILKAMAIPGLTIYHVESHLLVQRSLKLKMEAQSRFFDRITDDHRNMSTIIAKPNYKPSSSSSVSDAKEFESNSDGDITQIQSEEFRAFKRMRMTQYNKGFIGCS